MKSGLVVLMITKSFYEKKKKSDHNALLYHSFYTSVSLQNKLNTHQAAKVCFLHGLAPVPHPPGSFGEHTQSHLL